MTVAEYYRRMRRAVGHAEVVGPGDTRGGDAERDPGLVRDRAHFARSVSPKPTLEIRFAVLLPFTR